LAHAAVCKCVVYCSIVEDKVTYDYYKMQLIVQCKWWWWWWEL